MKHVFEIRNGSGSLRDSDLRAFFLFLFFFFFDERGREKTRKMQTSPNRES